MYDPADRAADAQEAHAIYAIVADQGDGFFVVKIGYSILVYQRYASLLPGIPFKSVMLWRFCGSRSAAMKLEKALHKLFAEYSTRGEWFRFTHDTKKIFHDGCKQEFYKATGRILSWARITDVDANRWSMRHRADHNSRKRSR